MAHAPSAPAWLFVTLSDLAMPSGIANCMRAGVSAGGAALQRRTAEVAHLLAAILAHLYLAWIHPFGDGNGRTARLVEYAILVSAGVPMPAAHLLSNHYNLTRAEYYRQLDRASQSGGDVIPFLRYAAQGLVDGLREQLELVRDQQHDVTWRDYVYEQFRDHAGEAAKRRRDLLLDLSYQAAPVATAGVKENDVEGRGAAVERSRRHEESQPPARLQ